MEEKVSFLESYIKILSQSYKAVITNHGAADTATNYIALTHIFSCSWDNEIINLIKKNLLFYCYEEKEFDGYTLNDFDDFENYILDAIRNRLNKKTTDEQRDGLLG
jgi:hypothetical protein